MWKCASILWTACHCNSKEWSNAKGRHNRVCRKILAWNRSFVRCVTGRNGQPSLENKSLCVVNTCKGSCRYEPEGPASVSSLLTLLWPLQVVIWTRRVRSHKTQIVCAAWALNVSVCTRWNATKSIWKSSQRKYFWLVGIAVFKCCGLLWTQERMCTWNRRGIRPRGFCCEALSPDASLARDRVRTVAGKNSLRLNTSQSRQRREGGRKIHVNPASPGNVIQAK